MGVSSHGAPVAGVGGATRTGSGAARWRGGIAVAAAILLALAACASSGRAGSSSESPSAEPTASPTMDAAVEASIDDLVADPDAWLDRRVELVGKVFFVAQCPPPGAESTPCVLVGYVADPDRGVLIAADVDEALPLAEDGTLVTCHEPGNGGGACGDWEREATYTLDGVLERQTLAGQERSKVQFDVLERSAPHG
ncbi:hypothetical protein GCM10017608_11320 [Agromyces luteolus]|uniref:Uncharacterized protein n=1 Tax=Agromyces luteolus TaxID=88373 RepID=A0A7C9LY72_9MICO|nr:hypothetical protein [Agromyces luteolus]MUN08659.1 hypothetical protein [Agromyces luteolus]GLK27199.1 hypothetical protein GCM10017608_11320 [Agromyces luteolus]